MAGERSALKRRSFVVAVGLIGGLLLVELAVRIATHSVFTWRTKESNDYVNVDPWVGRIPKPGVSVRLPGGFAINIGDHGTRSNGDTPAPGERPLSLVVGDSFAFGDGVNDEDSWPAILERITGERVVNAAIPGFGLDQAVLRAEQLAPVYAPDTIIVSFIPHDVLRCEMSHWSGHPKPYFDIEDGVLRLQSAATSHHPALVLLKKLLSLSATMNLLFSKFLYWEGPEEVIVHRRGREVGCLLMKRLAGLGRARQVRIVVLAQPQEPTATPEQLELKDGLLACAQDEGLLTLDVFPAIERLPLQERTQLFPRHMTAEGNRMIATELAGFLQQTASR